MKNVAKLQDSLSFMWVKKVIIDYWHDKFYLVFH